MDLVRRFNQRVHPHHYVRPTFWPREHLRFLLIFDGGWMVFEAQKTGTTETGVPHLKGEGRKEAFGRWGDGAGYKGRDSLSTPSFALEMLRIYRCHVACCDASSSPVVGVGEEVVTPVGQQQLFVQVVRDHPGISTRYCRQS